MCLPLAISFPSHLLITLTSKWANVLPIFKVEQWINTVSSTWTGFRKEISRLTETLWGHLSCSLWMNLLSNARVDNLSIRVATRPPCRVSDELVCSCFTFSSAFKSPSLASWIWTCERESLGSIKSTFFDYIGHWSNKWLIVI